MAQMKYQYVLTISSSPHVHSKTTTQTIMRDVLIGLVPAMIMAVYVFGLRSLTVTAVSVAACVFFEWLYCKMTGMHCKIYDLSACVTGVLLAFVCPVTIPYWTNIFGAAFSILLVKMLFGGLGKKNKYAVEEARCLRCGKCIDACPMKLMPVLMYKAMQDNDLDALKATNLMDCIECGSCAYTCPASVPLVLGFRVGKQLLRNAAAAAAKK